MYRLDMLDDALKCYEVVALHQDWCHAVYLGAQDVLVYALN